MHVSEVGSYGNLQFSDRPVSNLLTNRVMPYVDMFDPLVINRIASQVDPVSISMPNSHSISFKNVTSYVQLLRA
jgi:hypothetical protein